MDRTGALPDRCIVCNADAGGHRLKRKLYWSPLPWCIFAIATPFVVLAIGMANYMPLLTSLFWPIALVMMFAHTFVRRKLDLEIGICLRHRRWLAAARAAGFACIGGVLASIWLWSAYHAADIAGILLLGSLGGMLLVGIVQGFAGVQAVGLHRLDHEHVWLAGTGNAFREALPELPR